MFFHIALLAIEGNSEYFFVSKRIRVNEFQVLKYIYLSISCLIGDWYLNISVDLSSVPCWKSWISDFIFSFTHGKITLPG